jgi:beta-galactosidase
MKDEDNSLWPQRQPGLLAEMLGARVEQYYALDTTVPLSGDWGNAEDKIWAEQIGVKSPDTQVLMRYGKSNGWLDGQAAAVTRRVGKGSITYIGADLDAAGMKQAAAWMLKQSGVAAVMADLPESVDVAIRTGAGKRVVILTNYGETAATIQLPSAMEDVLKGGKVSAVTLEQYGVAVLQ